MKTSKFLLVFTVVLLFFSCKKETEIPPPYEPPHLVLNQSGMKTVQSNNNFGLELFKKNALTTSNNMMVSPLSVSVALGMTLNGAAGTTKTAMENALKLNGLTPHEINMSYKIILDYLLTVDPLVTLKIANSIWYRNTFSVLQSFFDTNSYYFNATINPLDFNDPNAKNIINTWVANQTQQKIKEIIDNINHNDVMFLINAIYFKGDWSTPFDVAKTIKYPFTLSNATVKNVDMMKNPKGIYKYTSNSLLSMIEMPYGYKRFNMIVMKPNEGKTILDIMNNLDNTSLNSWIKSLQTIENMEVGIPKFKFSFEKELKDILTDMGMGIAFTENADFTQINPLGDLFISKVKHKTFIDVNEKGTEAAAVTSVGISITSLPPSFIADRPFIFIIRESESNAILFIGKVENPNY